MSTTLTMYPDLLSGSSKAQGTSLEAEFRRRVRKVKKQCKDLKKHLFELKEKHTAELVRIAEECRIAKEEKQKEDSFFSNVKNAIVKSIPSVLTAIAGFFVKKWFSSK